MILSAAFFSCGRDSNRYKRTSLDARNLSAIYVGSLHFCAVEPSNVQYLQEETLKVSLPALFLSMHKVDQISAVLITHML